MSAADFNRVLLTNSEFLMPFAFTLTNDKEDAKDLFQETLFRALANKDK
jgi:DNA-directed RNA polymerase specialized sigma24 family protein